jgi:hypothetical protein
MQEQMPLGRRSECGMPREEIVSSGVGLYQLSIRNAAPFSAGVDTGYAVFVQAVGSNAHCFEESTHAAVDGTFTLVARIRCVAPSGNPAINANVNSNFAWSYRTDSLSYPQLGTSYPSNFAYARINRADGSIVPDQSFNPSTTHEVLGTRTAVGRYEVVFKDSSTSALNNVIVQKTCDRDTSASCPRSVCTPHSWSSGSSGVRNTTVSIRCYGPDGVDRNTDFRVFVGDGPHNSQVLTEPDFGLSGRYGFFNYSRASTGNTCFAPSAFVHRSLHETPRPGAPGVPNQLCKTATGRYTINFDSSYFIGGHQIAPYHQDAISPVVSSRTAKGGYCNPHQIECNAGNCTGVERNPPARLHVRCYTRAGAPQNSAWNMSMFY